jgi:hypothetical protein
LQALSFFQLHGFCTDFIRRCRSCCFVIECRADTARNVFESCGLCAEAIGSAAAACPVFPAAGAVTVQLGGLLP